MIINEQANTRLTLKETALLSGVTEKTIRHELAASVVSAPKTRRRRLFGAHDVFYFGLVSALPISLRKDDRRDLFNLIVRRQNKRGRWLRKTGRLVLAGPVPVELATEQLLHSTIGRFRKFLRGRRRVVSHPDILGGEPVFHGTRISVRSVGERVRKGESISDILEDFPPLSAADLEFAGMFVALGRPPGRPRKLKFRHG